MLFSLSRYTGIKNSSGSKAPRDINIILEKNKFHTYQLYKHDIKFIKTIESCVTIFLLKIIVKKEDLIIIQWPLYLSKLINLNSIFNIKASKKIVLINDIESLRFDPFNSRKQEEEVQLLNNFDICISHNIKMTEWLKNKGYRNKIINLGVFDYLCNINKDKKLSNNYTIAFAGNLDKSSFIKDYCKYSQTKMYIYGQKPKYKTDCIYKGNYKSEELINKIKESFGLIWDGKDCMKCSGNLGNYLRYNNPHKLSLYIACGMPIITWSESAIANFILDNNIGFTINSINEIDSKLKILKFDDYLKMKKNIEKISDKISKGIYTELAINKAMEEK